MAARYFCDGCDQEVSQDRNVVVHVAPVPNAPSDLRDRETSMLDSKLYHLCEGCYMKLKRDADPTTWARAARAA